jgi:hypothetical protein
MNPNKKFKNSVFCCLFSNEDTLRELYNAITGSNYDSSTPITITTLDDALFMDRVNDTLRPSASMLRASGRGTLFFAAIRGRLVCAHKTMHRMVLSFTIGNDKLVVLIEHQSTINQNMPLRFLLYIARVYERIINTNKDIYRTKRIKLPTPEFIVLYNGVTDLPDVTTQLLSEAFATPPGENSMELRVAHYNINKGHNEGMAQKCGTLDGYAAFVAEVGKNNKTMPLGEAIKSAAGSCIKQGILVDFLKTHASEVLNMLTAEWDWDVAKEVWQEEAREEAWEDAWEKATDQYGAQLADRDAELADRDVRIAELERQLVGYRR